jgi:hypothetical protein
MYSLVNVDHNSMAVHPIGRRILESAVYPLQQMKLMIGCGMAVKRMGMSEVSASKMKALTVKMKTVTMSSKGR